MPATVPGSWNCKHQGRAVRCVDVTSHARTLLMGKQRAQGAPVCCKPGLRLCSCPCSSLERTARSLVCAGHSLPSLMFKASWLAWLSLSPQEPTADPVRACNADGPLEFLFVAESEDDAAWPVLSALAAQHQAAGTGASAGEAGRVVRLHAAGLSHQCSQKIHKWVQGSEQSKSFRHHFLHCQKIQERVQG